MDGKRRCQNWNSNTFNLTSIIIILYCPLIFNTKELKSTYQCWRKARILQSREDNWIYAFLLSDVFSGTDDPKERYCLSVLQVSPQLKEIFDGMPGTLKLRRRTFFKLFCLLLLSLFDVSLLSPNIFKRNWRETSSLLLFKGGYFQWSHGNEVMFLKYVLMVPRG